MEARNGNAHGEEEEVAEGETAEEEVTEGDEEEAVEETDEVTEDTVIATQLQSNLP